jgi:molybdenum cofactor cytidylyltransferase
MSNNHVTAIVLAAGSSTRMDGENKLARSIDGDPLLLRSISKVLASDVQRCIVVVSEQNDDTLEMLSGLDIDIITCSGAKQGMSASIRSGVIAAGKYTQAYLICLPDMPDLNASHFNLVIDAYKKFENKLIIRPITIAGQTGHPVLIDKRFYPELMCLTGDMGARAIIENNVESVFDIKMDDAVITDLDTPQAWINWVASRCD